MMSVTYKEAVHIVLLCLAWYTASSANGVVGKLVLSDFPYPMTVSMVQLVSISIYLLPVLWLWQVPSAKASHIPLKYWFQMLLPLALGKFFSSVSSHISIWKVPVSYAHTVKATMPFFTVLLSRFIMKERQTRQVYVSLIPIVFGVIIASMTELSFDLIGLISALVSTLGFAIQNIFSKKCLKDTGLHQFRLLFILASVSGILCTPLWVMWELTRIIHDTNLINSTHTPRLILLLLIDGFCNFTQNVVAFSVIALVSPLSYAVANCTKRIAVITVSLIFLQNPFSSLNLLGMMMAILGVLLYNKAKFDQRQADGKKPPVIQTTDSVAVNLAKYDQPFTTTADLHSVPNGSAHHSYSNGRTSNSNGDINHSTAALDGKASYYRIV